MLSKLVAVSLKKGKDWKDFRPYEAMLLDNKFDPVNIADTRSEVVGQFQAFIDAGIADGTLKVNTTPKKKRRRGK